MNASLPRIDHDPLKPPHENHRSGTAEDLLPSAHTDLEQFNHFQDREEAAVTRLQANIKAISKFFGSSAYFIFVVVFLSEVTTTTAERSAATWLDAVADGRLTMSQRRTTAIEQHVGGLDAVRAMAVVQCVHLVQRMDEVGDLLGAARLSPSRSSAEGQRMTIAAHPSWRLPSGEKV